VEKIVKIHGQRHRATPQNYKATSSPSNVSPATNQSDISICSDDQFFITLLSILISSVEKNLFYLYKLMFIYARLKINLFVFVFRKQNNGAILERGRNAVLCYGKC
jgi:hypothetical protein